jgi:anti-anti-sigma factor
MLHLKLEFVNRGTIVFCQGRLGWSEAGALLKTVFSMQGCDYLTLDLSGVYSIDARGLGALAAIAKWALHKSVKFAVSNPTRRVEDLIRLVDLNTVLSIIAIEHTPSELAIAHDLASDTHTRTAAD